MALMSALWVHAALAQDAPEKVSIPIADGAAITGEYLRPAGTGPFPAVVALHGCSGLYARDHKSLSARHEDWARRLVEAGYAVLLPDSFNARGYVEICTKAKRPITPRDRAEDALAAARWLAARSEVDAGKLGLIGWSHGAMTVLWTVRPEFMPAAPRFLKAFAFYPGCRQIAHLEGWKPAIPLTVLSGALDDWTEPGPCRELAKTAGYHYVEYPGAYHDFDAPDVPVHVRKGLSAVRSGQAHIGTNYEARKAAIAEVMGGLAGVR